VARAARHDRRSIDARLRERLPALGLRRAAPLPAARGAGRDAAADPWAERARALRPAPPLRRAGRRSRGKLMRAVVCRRDELAPGEKRALELGGRRIVLVRTGDGRYFALA